LSSDDCKSTQKELWEIDKKSNCREGSGIVDRWIQEHCLGDQRIEVSFNIDDWLACGISDRSWAEKEKEIDDSRRSIASKGESQQQV
jgi:hypothetical protein